MGGFAADALVMGLNADAANAAVPAAVIKKSRRFINASQYLPIDRPGDKAQPPPAEGAQTVRLRLKSIPGCVKFIAFVPVIEFHCKIRHSAVTYFDQERNKHER